MNLYVIEFEAEENKDTCDNLAWQTEGNKLLLGGEISLIKTEKGWKGRIIECGEKVDGRWTVTNFCRKEL